MNRENHESIRDVNHSPLPFTSTIWPHISEVIGFEQGNLWN